MTEKTRFVIIGPGVMGEAIIAGLLRKETHHPRRGDRFRPALRAGRGAGGALQDRFRWQH